MDEFSVLKMQKKKKITTVIQQSKDQNKKKQKKINTHRYSNNWTGWNQQYGIEASYFCVSWNLSQYSKWSH